MRKARRQRIIKAQLLAQIAAKEAAQAKEESAQGKGGSTMWRPITKIMLVAIGTFLVLYDILPFVDQARHDTISEVIAEYSLKLVTLPVLFGALCGHFFFLRDDSKPRMWINFILLGFFIGLDFLTYKLNIAVMRDLQGYPAVWFCLGVPLGVLFWPQTKSDKE